MAAGADPRAPAAPGSVAVPMAEAGAAPPERPPACAPGPGAPADAAAGAAGAAEAAQQPAILSVVSAPGRLASMYDVQKPVGKGGYAVRGAHWIPSCFSLAALSCLELF